VEDSDRDVVNGAATVAILLALLSVVAGFLPYYGIFALPIAIPALVAAVIARRRSKTEYKPGRVLSIVALVLGSIGALLGALNIFPGWQAGVYVSNEPLLKDLTPMTCDEFELPEEWDITYEAVRRPIWVIDFEGPDGGLEYVALRYKSASCRAHPQIAPLLD
jgi:hypothetical protein